MSNTKKYIVYIHTNRINNKSYIGITSQKPEDRWGKNGNKYKKDQPVFYNAIQKYKWENFDHIIFAENLSESEAKHIEVLLIGLYKTNVCRWKKNACGYNMTDGGEGTSGWCPSEEYRQKHSEIFKGLQTGEKNPMYGKKHTEETRKKISEALIGEKHPLYGKHRSDEIRKKLSESKKGNKNPNWGKKASKETCLKKSEAMKGKLIGDKNPCAKSVLQIDFSTGEVIARFGSMKEAERITNVSACNIGRVVSGKYKQAGGYFWSLDSGVTI